MPVLLFVVGALCGLNLYLWLKLRALNRRKASLMSREQTRTGQQKRS